MYNEHKYGKNLTEALSVRRNVGDILHLDQVVDEYFPFKQCTVVWAATDQNGATVSYELEFPDGQREYFWGPNNRPKKRRKRYVLDMVFA